MALARILTSSLAASWLALAIACGALPVGTGCDPDDEATPPRNDAGPPQNDAGSSTDVTVATDSGAVVGAVATNGVRSFLGIPYAAAPVGAQRWKAPKEIHWDQARGAKAFGPRCVGVSLLDPKTLRAGASEDCLSLNIWSPGGAEPKAVLFWLHGGGLIDGTGNDYPGSALAAAGDVVVVTINYRLGALGTLALPSADGGGNLALLDQQFALQWIRRNIAAFGGDPSKVTVAGESAGAQGVCMQASLPSSQGLFRGLILQSGGCDGTQTPAQAASNANDMAKAWGCARGGDDAGDAGTSLDEACLRALPAETIVRGNNSISMLPIVDGQLLPTTPRAAMKAGTFANVPVLVGFNANEGFFFTDGQFAGVPLVTPADYTAVLAAAFGPFGPVLENEYPLASYGGDPRAALAAIMGDANTECSTRSLLASSRAPAFAYRFEHAPTLASPKPVLAMHTIELPYLWDIALPWTWWNEANAGIPSTPGELELAKQMKRHWSAFVRAQDPEWPAWSAESKNAMAFAEGTAVKPLPPSAHCAFWDGLYGAP